MHSSRMHTARSSSRPRGSPPGTPLDQTPWDQAPPPGTRHPPPGTRHPPGTTHPRDQTPPWDQAPPRPGTPGTRYHTPPPVNRITDKCKNITLPQTSFAGGNYSKRAGTCHPATPCVKDQDAITTPARHM